MKKKGFGVSPITNTIYYGELDAEKEEWTGEKIDVTQDAVKAVYQWFMNSMEDKDGELEEYGIVFPDTGFELVMRRQEVRHEHRDE